MSIGATELNGLLNMVQRTIDEHLESKDPYTLAYIGLAYGLTIIECFPYLEYPKDFIAQFENMLRADEHDQG